MKKEDFYIGQVLLWQDENGLCTIDMVTELTDYYFKYKTIKIINMAMINYPGHGKVDFSIQHSGTWRELTQLDKIKYL